MAVLREQDHVPELVQDEAVRVSRHRSDVVWRLPQLGQPQVGNGTAACEWCHFLGFIHQSSNFLAQNKYDKPTWQTP